ncbi:hypothetical protein NDU88_000642 [Pleurodeles waltl]|uniref:Uncharacterized protein n=1 Tax=Pleurodeles waltl TaxID=8319 RepID=A0AAV7VUQ7_PLEWA|nr:hypothetical protein NDU88_000642 [Pleurodeles waltl]
MLSWTQVNPISRLRVLALRGPGNTAAQPPGAPGAQFRTGPPPQPSLCHSTAAPSWATAVSPPAAEGPPGPGLPTRLSPPRTALAGNKRGPRPRGSGPPLCAGVPDSLGAPPAPQHQSLRLGAQTIVSAHAAILATSS